MGEASRVKRSGLLRSLTVTSRLYGLALQSSLTTTEDSTQYGTARTSPSSFLAHHLASISAAVVYADAQELCTAGKATSHGLTIGLAP